MSAKAIRNNETVLNPASQETNNIGDPEIMSEMEGANLPAVRPAYEMAAFDGSPVTFERAELEVVYGVGENSEQGMHSDALCMKIGPKATRRYLELALAKKPVVAVILGYRRIWREWPKEYVPGSLPREYQPVPNHPDTVPPDALSDGLNGDWQNVLGEKSIGPTIQKAMYLDLLIRQPEGVEDDIFCLKLSGNWYAPTVFRADKGFFTPVNRVLSTMLVKDAGERGVPLSEARVDKYFMTLASFASMRATGRKGYSVVLGRLIENGKVCPVPDDFSEGLKNLVEGAFAAEEEEPPF